MKSFKHDLLLSDLFTNTPLGLNELIACYNQTLTSILDKHAPLMKKTITVRPRVPWFNATIKDAKKLRRKLERKWRKSGSTTDRQLFSNARNLTSGLMDKARRDLTILISSVRTAPTKEDFSKRLINYLAVLMKLSTLHILTLLAFLTILAGSSLRKLQISVQNLIALSQHLPFQTYKKIRLPCLTSLLLTSNLSHWIMCAT